MSRTLPDSTSQVIDLNNLEVLHTHVPILGVSSPRYQAKNNELSIRSDLVV